MFSWISVYGLSRAVRLAVAIQSENGNGKEAIDEVSADVPLAVVKKSQAWKILKAEIRQRQGEVENKRIHFCTVCGYYGNQKWNVVEHAQGAKAKASHCAFKSIDAVLLDDIEQYYHRIKNADSKLLHSKAQLFLKAVLIDPEKPAREPVPSVIKNSQAWRGLKAEIRKRQGEFEAKRIHFCTVCGYYGNFKSNVVRHAQGATVKASHPNFKSIDAVLLDDIGNYYHRIKNADSKLLHSTAQLFLQEVLIDPEQPVREPVPQIFKTSEAWRGLNAEIRKRQGEFQANRIHFCTICGYYGNFKGNIVKHAQGAKFKESHLDFKWTDAVLLDNMEQYYRTIEKLKSPHEKVSAFLSSISKSKRSTTTTTATNNETRKNKKRKVETTKVETAAVKNPRARKRSRKHKHPRQVPNGVFSATRFRKEVGPATMKKQKFMIPSGCENEVTIKLEPGDTASNTKLEKEEVDDDGDGSEFNQPLGSCVKDEYRAPSDQSDGRIKSEEGIKIKKEKGSH